MIPLLPPEEALKRFNDAHIADAVKDPVLAKSMSQLNVFRALLNNPTITHAQSGLAGALMGSKTLNPRIRELVILRTGWRTKSEYEFVQHPQRSVFVISQSRNSSKHRWSNQACSPIPPICLLPGKASKGQNRRDAAIGLETLKALCRMPTMSPT